MEKQKDAGKSVKKNKINLKITSLDIDKAEYQQIVQSNSNFPDRDLKK